MARVAVFMAKGTEEIEALTVVDLLRRKDISVDMVSIGDGVSVTGSHGIEIKTDKLIDDVDWDELEMIVLPGGMPGTNNLMACAKLVEQIKIFVEQGKKVSAICAAPSVLGVNHMLEGKKATCYPGFEDKLIGAEVVKEPVVVDGNIITSRGLGTAIDFSAAIIASLKSENDAKDILEKIIYQA
ncbi:MAG: DJ-1/PfpI family protein [Lachnospiraceae bacterium]|nr:DJ-1/PfpI family protein [Lachnospiraceae bacterium]